MNVTATKKQVESALATRFRDALQRRERRPVETLPSGVAELDRLIHGFPRGAITEIHGAPSSGRTSLLLSTMAGAIRQDESCALVDCNGTFDLSSATNAGVEFNRLLWIRCNSNLEDSFKAADLLLHGGGFGLVALNLGDVQEKSVRRIISSWWFRFRRALENTPTALIVITPAACIRSCAALVLELRTEVPVWSNTLSLVSENDCGAFTAGKSQQRPHLSLVGAIPQSDKALLAHSHFLQELTIRVNTERPVEWSGVAVKFHPFLTLTPGLAMFENIR